MEGFRSYSRPSSFPVLLTLPDWSLPSISAFTRVFDALWPKRKSGEPRIYACPSGKLQSGSVRRTGKEDGREYELKPSIVVQRVQLPPGKGQSASRKPALRVTAMVALSVGEQVPKLRESASKSTNAEALVVRIAGAASTWPL